MRVLITGANGFIGKNLVVRLKELTNITVSTFVRGEDTARLPQLVAQADAVVHLAGENRPADEVAFSNLSSNLKFQPKDSRCAGISWQEIGGESPLPGKA